MAFVGRRFVIGWLLMAILLPVYGPWINGRFPAWQPDHDHIYLDEVDPHHPHTNSETPSDIIMLPGKNLFDKQLLIIAIPLDQVLLNPFDTPCVGFLGEQPLFPRLVFISPPERPPYAMVLPTV